MYDMTEISPTFKNIQVWGLWWPFQNLYLSFLEVLRGLFRGRYLVESILPSTLTSIFPVPPVATQPQGIMNPPPCIIVGKASHFFLQTYLLLWWPKYSILDSLVQRTSMIPSNWEYCGISGEVGVI